MPRRREKTRQKQQPQQLFEQDDGWSAGCDAGGPLVGYNGGPWATTFWWIVEVQLSEAPGRSRFSETAPRKWSATQTVEELIEAVSDVIGRGNMCAV